MVSVLLLLVDTWIVPTLGYCWLCGFEHCVCVSWWMCPWSTPRSNTWITVYMSGQLQ